MKLKGSLSQAGASLVLADGATGQTTLTSASTATRVITFPDATTTVVGTDTTQTLTNKTFTSPTLTTPALGVATATSINGLTISTTTGTLTIANSKTLSLTTGSLTLVSDASDTVATFPASGSITLVDLNTAQTLTNKTLTSPKLNENVALTTTATKLNYLTSAAGTTGTTSTNIVFSTSPTLVTPVLGAATATTINGLTISSTNGTLTIPNSSSLIRSGAHAMTLTSTNTTNVTFPTTGTLATLAGTETLSGKLITVANGAAIFQSAEDTTRQVKMTWAGGLSNGVTTLSFGASSAQTITFSDSGSDTVALVNTNQVLAGKTLTSPTVNSGTIVTSTIDDYLDVNEEAAPATPSSGKVRLYATTAKKLFVKNSDGTTTEIGSSTGAGEKNYVTNPSGVSDAAAAVPTGWANVGDLDIVVTKTAADLPREYTTAAGLKITADANVQSTADYVYYDFTLDDVDLSKKLKISWSQKVTGTYAAGDLAVVITTQADRTTAVATPVTTAIPAVDGVFTTSFDAGTTATLSLVIRATTDMTTNGGIVISDVVVGPGIQPQGAVATDTQTVTFTGSWVSNTTYDARETRVGSWAEYVVKVSTSGAPTSASLTLTLPTGRTIDSAALPSLTNSAILPGSAVSIRDSGTATFIGEAQYNTTTTVAVMYTDDAAGGVVNAAVTQAAPMTWASGDSLVIAFRVPIAEWAGSGTVNIAQNDVEYASNSSATSSDDTTSFAYGFTGSDIPSITASGVATQVQKRVRFPTAFQAGEHPLVLVQLAGTGTWVPVGVSIDYPVEILQNTGAAARHYGICARRVSGSSTDVDIFFGGAGRTPTGTSYGATGSNFPANSGDKYVVVKAKGGQTVGFGLATTDGVAGLVNPYTAGSGVIYSGTYTPTLTNTTNVAASTAYVCQYVRIGAVVTVSGAVDIDPTSGSVQTVLGMSLPIASTFSSIANLGGTCVGQTTTTRSSGIVFADTSNNRATFDIIVSADTANRAYTFSFTYRII